MMDTGIDVPECVNLVFFKKVCSKTKFWQMIGRGTRLCPDLACVDENGAYIGKKYFYIFDYCGNFEFFKEHTAEIPGGEVKSLTENIFCRQIQLIAALQSSNFAVDNYQSFRTQLVDTCHAQIAALNPELTAVRLQRRYVEKYKEKTAFTCLKEGEQSELARFIAPLVYIADDDEQGKQFDNLIYSLMLAQLEHHKRQKYLQQKLSFIAEKLSQKATISLIKTKLPLLQRIMQTDFWSNIDILELEKIRYELRSLIKFLVEDGKPAPIIETNVHDTVLEEKSGYSLPDAISLDNYRRKVNRYICEHGDSSAIHKLTHNIPLSSSDYQELERIFTQELGNAEDYRREFGDTPFGLLIRRVAKLDHAAAMQAFSQFINDQSLNQNQIAFISKVISHIENNGYIDNPAILLKAPFDTPVSFLKLFDSQKQLQIVQILNSVKTNATYITA